jgi:death-on-curing protein
LTVADILDVHREVLFENEDFGVLKPLELDAAVLAVQATFGGAPLLQTLAQVAAAYVFYLNRSDVFMDGNKRTSLFSAFVFLEVNGFQVEIDEDFWIEAVVGVVQHEVSQDELVGIFTERMGGDPGMIEW